MTLDASAIAALATLVVAILGAVVGYVKVKPEAESIATKTTLEVNESLRQERAEARKEAAELRVALRERDEEISLLQLKVASMRQSVESLEAEVNALKGKTSEARRTLGGD
jgi:uncharacterized protein HemX